MRREGPYRGEHRFEADAIIYSTVVHSSGQSDERPNPDLEACRTTPTSSPTVSPTPDHKAEMNLTVSLRRTSEAADAEVRLHNGNSYEVRYEVTVRFRDSNGAVLRRQRITGSVDANSNVVREVRFDSVGWRDAVEATGELAVIPVRDSPTPSPSPTPSF